MSRKKPERPSPPLRSTWQPAQLWLADRYLEGGPLRLEWLRKLLAVHCGEPVQLPRAAYISDEPGLMGDDE